VKAPPPATKPAVEKARKPTAISKPAPTTAPATRPSR
jgi:hypothetical protein